MAITLPYKYNPRPYQLPALKAADNGVKRIITVWPRRSGKDLTWFNYIVKRAYQRVGTYYYLFPTYNQGAKILWRGMDKNGFRFIDYCPEQIRKRLDNGEMLIELTNGSIIQVVGTDNIDNLVGTNPIGCVFSEYSLQDPRAWAFIRPILAENGGFAIFDFTPRGRMNHGWDLLELGKTDPHNWFSEVLTVDQTKHISPEALEQEKREMFNDYKDDSLFLQEYYCSFDVAVQGSYYGRWIEEATKEKRITSVPINNSLPIDTWWDLGVGDATAIWFTQNVGKEIHIVDYYEATGEGLPYYAKVLQDKKYIYGTHNAPFDIGVTELGTGKSRLETAQKLGIRFRVVPRLPLDDGIHAVRQIFNRCWFDETKCKQGLNALGSYHKEYDEKRREYKNSPFHDWSSHGADSFRYFATGHKASPVKRDDFIGKKNVARSYSLKMA